MILAVVVVSLTYIVPVAAMWITGAPAASWETGSWADLAGLVGGQGLRIALVLGGMMSAFGMFNALVMSYSRLPLAMAQDGMLPQIFAKKTKESRSPWVAIVALAIGWGLCLGLNFEHLITLDILLYGTSLMLEFIALVALRLREPTLRRPFRVPGGMLGAVMLGVCPLLLLGFSVVRSENETVLGLSSLKFGLILIAGGFVAYGLKTLFQSSAPIPVLAQKPPDAM